MENRHSILIVDDDPEIRQLLREFLEKNGYEVIEAEDGRQALTLVEQKQPDLVITDLLLPREHGIDVMQTIKDRYLLPIIVMSGIYKKDEIKNRIQDIFIEDFFEKPLDLNGILACLHSILDE